MDKTMVVVIGFILVILIILAFFGVVFAIGLWLIKKENDKSNPDTSKDKPEEKKRDEGKKDAYAKTVKKFKYWIGWIIALIAIFSFGFIFFYGDWSNLFSGHIKAVVGILAICIVLALILSARFVAGLLAIILLVILTGGVIYELSGQKIPEWKWTKSSQGTEVGASRQTLSAPPATSASVTVSREDGWKKIGPVLCRRGNPLGINVWPQNAEALIHAPYAKPFLIGRGHERDVIDTGQTISSEWENWMVRTEHPTEITIEVIWGS